MRPWKIAAGFVAMIFGSLIASASPALAEEARIDTLKALFARLGTCWKSPHVLPQDPGMQITVMLSFKHNGELLGAPKITYESEYASDSDRLIYRRALREALQRCLPMPFTDELGAAVAGRPLRILFDARHLKSI
jgi:hypothetical protein